jgi:hypothetical protein
MSVEVLLDTPEISVIGPPATILLQLETGATGDKGNLGGEVFDEAGFL